MYLRRTIAAIAAIAAASCPIAFAQNAAPPAAHPQQQSNVQVQLNTQMEQMMPMLERMMDSMMTAQSRAAAKPEVAEAAAAFKRNLYDSLRKKGFTAQEALQIVIATPLPAVPVASK